MLDRPRATYFKLMSLLAAAPNMALKDAVSIASQWADEEIKAFDAQQALAILTDMLGFKHGAIPAKYANVDDATKWALQKAQYCNGWVCCGPVDRPMERLKEDIAKNCRIENWHTAEPETP